MILATKFQQWILESITILTGKKMQLEDVKDHEIFYSILQESLLSNETNDDKKEGHIQDEIQDNNESSAVTQSKPFIEGKFPFPKKPPSRIIDWFLYCLPLYLESILKAHMWCHKDMFEDPDSFFEFFESTKNLRTMRSRKRQYGEFYGSVERELDLKTHIDINGVEFPLHPLEVVDFITGENEQVATSGQINPAFAVISIDGQEDLKISRKERARRVPQEDHVLGRVLEKESVQSQVGSSVTLNSPREDTELKKSELPVISKENPKMDEGSDNETSKPTVDSEVDDESVGDSSQDEDNEEVVGKAKEGSIKSCEKTDIEKIEKSVSQRIDECHTIKDMLDEAQKLLKMKKSDMSFLKQMCRSQKDHLKFFIALAEKEDIDVVEVPLKESFKRLLDKEGSADGDDIVEPPYKKAKQASKPN